MQDRIGMEAPGMSLFQGSGSIQINAASHGLEEDEEQQDFQRRNKELKVMLLDAFDDLDEEDDGSSSVNSSNFQDASRDADHNVSSSIVVNDSSIQPITSDKGPTYQNDVSTLDGNINYAMSTPFPRSDDKRGSPISDINKQFDIYNQIGTPLNSHRDNSILNSTSKSSYELPRPPNLQNPMTFPNDLRAQINEGYTLLENIPYNSNYHTPANHYDVQNAKFSNNGYIETYDNNISQKNTNDIHEIDNDTTSDHYNHCYQTSPNGRPIVNDSVNAYKTAEYNSKEQLEVLYAVRVKEIERLRGELQQLQIAKEEEKNELSRKLVLAQAEAQRSDASRNKARDALIDAKAEIIQLQTQAESFKEKVAVLEKTNKNMSEELSVAKESVIDLQQKIAVLERVQSLQANDKTHEKFIKQVQEKHAVEMKNMQTQIDVLTAKLNEKESMYNSLENKLAEVRRAHEALIVEKGESMNQLAKALENSQNQCRDLMATNNAQEIMQLKNRVKILTQNNEELSQTIQELQHKLDVAKSDVLPYDSLLTTAIDEESDSIRQLKLGEFHSKSKDKSNDDIMSTLRVELQRCVAGNAIKRKEISRLENTLAQKDEELKKAYAAAETCQQEAAKYAKRVNELEEELNNFVTEHSVKATSQIQKLTEHLMEVREQNSYLMTEKQKLQEKLEETLASQEETIKKFHQETMAQYEKQNIDEYNKQYLEIHNKAIERARKEAQLEMVQLQVQLEQTQKELDRVKQLYIQVCGTKEQLIDDHKNEIKTLKEKYTSFEIQKNEIDHIKSNLEVQLKINKRLTQECESLKKKNIELEKDLSYERRKKLENTRKIHQEIERAKEEALTELRNAHPDHQISILLPDYCSEHSDKIAQLENDCKRLEEKLSCALEEQKKMADLQHEDLEAKIKIAQMEITYETLKKKYTNLLNEKEDLLDKISKLQQEMADFKNSQKTDDVHVSLKISDLESDKLKNLCENLFKEKITYQSKIIDLESKLIEYKNKIAKFESNKSKSNESLSTTRTELEQELCQYKELVKKLNDQLNSPKDFRKDEERLKQLELELKEKEVQLQRLEDLEKIKGERDQLITKLKNQAQQFEEYVKNQKQVSAELNLSPRNTVDTNELQKLRELSIKEVREEMEQKVAEELRGIEDQHKEKRKAIEDKYRSALTELNNRYADKTKELEAMREMMMTEKKKLQSSFKAQEQIVTQMIEVKIREYKQELLSRKLTTEKLQAELQQKERDVEEVKNAMAQVMSEWVAEIQAAKEAETRLQQEVNKLEETAKAWKEEEKELKNSLDTYKRKYQSAKLSIQKYKKYAEEKENFLMSECKRIEDGYKKAISQVQQNFDEIVSTQEKQMEEKLKELESQYEEKLQQLRRNMKYKDKH
ncbi:putative leucine-rich repeat-containing protein DDB_G0290503 [Chelonus insularis]|uniref:putative leucine-rich repeat-containing protein DDB_G0290503 n=1 Tax=Chelonus insularis TaxID=460826 RepID=UPI00158EACDF|nr:putative leucine-rich repeat-containing protein DDB_G0290503 [Chelonus insularis]